MRENLDFLHLGMILSLLLHGALLQSLYTLSQSPGKKSYQSSYMVPIKVSPLKPVAEKKKSILEKKEIFRITKKTKVNPLPVSHIKREKVETESIEEAKPVFGVTPETVVPDGDSGIGVRIGNTLMKEQEKEYPPPEKARQYMTIPLFEISSLPSYKSRVIPEYPDKLKEEGIEGEVMLVVTIDETGRVVDVRVKHTDHQLFSQAAVEAIKKCLFKPATKNGKPVMVKIDIPIKFILDT